MGKKIFVTVGTTKFDELINAIDSYAFGRALVENGFDCLFVQYGNTNLHFSELLAGSSNASKLRLESLWVESTDFLPSIQEHIESSSLIICHAGAGSIFEGLRSGKQLIVVPNELLMDNHQVELASHLDALGHLVSSAPDHLAKSISIAAKKGEWKPWPGGGPEQIVSRINQVVIPQKQSQKRG